MSVAAGLATSIPFQPYNACLAAPYHSQEWHDSKAADVACITDIPVSACARLSCMTCCAFTVLLPLAVPQDKQHRQSPATILLELASGILTKYIFTGLHAQQVCVPACAQQLMASKNVLGIAE